MSDAIAAPQHSTMPKRYFWRRAAAYIADGIIFGGGFALLFYVLAQFTPIDLTFAFVNAKSCAPAADSPLIHKVEAEWPIDAQQSRRNLICHISWPGGRGYDAFITFVSSRNGAATYTRFVSTVIDANGNPVAPAVAATMTGAIGGYVVVLLLPITFALSSSSGRRTPGKKLLSLRTAAVDESPASFGRELARECLRLLPLILIALVSLAGIYIWPPQSLGFDDAVRGMSDGKITALDVPLMTYLTTITFILGLIWWFLPFLMWRGQTYYDRICGTKVEKI